MTSVVISGYGATPDAAAKQASHEIIAWFNKQGGRYTRVQHITMTITDVSWMTQNQTTYYQCVILMLVGSG